MIEREELIHIGKFNKPHGIHGEISFTFTDDLFDRLDVPFFVCEMDQIFVPFFIEEYRFRSENGALVTLADIESDVQAKVFTNKEVYILKRFCEESDEPISSKEYFTGFQIIDTQGQSIGTILYLDDSTINLLFVVENEGTQRLIPATDEWVERIDSEQKIITMNLPEGILDLE